MSEATVIDELCKSVDGSRMMSILAVLAKWPKLSGTRQEAESLAFVKSRLDELGYVTKIIEHDAYISLPGPARLTVGGESFEAITHSMAPPTPPNGLRNSITDIGAGDENAYANRDLVGHILLIDGIPDYKTATRASDAGAIAHINVSPHDYLHEMCVSPVWGNPSPRTVRKFPTASSVTISLTDGKRIRDLIAKNPQASAVIEAEVDTGWRTTPILVADLLPNSLADDAPFLLFSGHHDTWHYGVMDNGAANALMLEVARVCATKSMHWRRALRLCFWSGHSHARYTGSAWYADEYWDELDRRCVAHVNIDSPGGVGASVLTEAVVTPELHDLGAAAIFEETGQTIAGKRKLPGADESFRGVGVASLFNTLSKQPLDRDAIRNRLGWWWHTPFDLIDKVDDANLARDARIITRVVWHLLSDPILPLNYARHARLLSKELEKIATNLGSRLTITGLINDAKLTTGYCERILTDVELPPDRVNSALMRVSRALVPMDYTTGDRFEHDPSLAMPWPVLEPLRQLAAATEDLVLLMRVDAIRARNRMAHALREANAALANALSKS